MILDADDVQMGNIEIQSWIYLDMLKDALQKI